ncbi:hypothetical protein [Liquorilactobacillus vini]|uniref:hypothetical protein n=1 Tax=Liquorilactobacillus vini TaxID=238015 RepID=UPI0002F9AEBC|nr:hypothetical protein [Liquorilactobacillus vini]
MKLIPVKQAAAMIKQIIKGKTARHIELLTKKKDRSIIIEIEQANIKLCEQGYFSAQLTYPLASSAAKRAIQTAFKREFPRSHRVYVSCN